MKRGKFNDYKSILCLNGYLPEAAFLTHFNLPIIAADGAANQLHELGIIPQLIIGDLDSLKRPMHDNCNVLYMPDQNSTDFQKTLSYLNKNNLLPAIVVGINGGYLDHILNNINIFMGTDCVLYAPPIIGYVLKEQNKYHFELPCNSKISLIGVPSALLSSKGLKWELEQTQLSFPGNTSCFNRTKEPIVELTVHQGNILALIYQGVMIDSGGITK